MLSALPEGAAIHLEVARRGESLVLRAELIVRLTVNGRQAESRRQLHEEAGPPRQAVATLRSGIDENLAAINTNPYRT